jgi:Tfp pilus assembly protein PilO
MTLLKRIVIEKRSLLWPLALGLLLNIAAYALIVRPKELKVKSADVRSAAAAQAVQAAERDLASARALVSGKSQAEEALSTFYNKVLPADFSAARRMTFTRLPELAQQTNVTWGSRTSDIERVQGDARLGRVRIRTIIQGQYENVRQFIYELESSPEFIIIDDVTLSQADADKPLNLTLQLSTYYRVDSSGA